MIPRALLCKRVPPPVTPPVTHVFQGYSSKQKGWSIQIFRWGTHDSLPENWRKKEKSGTGGQPGLGQQAFEVAEWVVYVYTRECVEIGAYIYIYIYKFCQCVLAKVSPT